MPLAALLLALAILDDPPTYHRDVAPILQRHCQDCHPLQLSVSFAYNVAGVADGKFEFKDQREAPHGIPPAMLRDVIRGYADAWKSRMREGLKGHISRKEIADKELEPAGTGDKPSEPEKPAGEGGAGEAPPAGAAPPPPFFGPVKSARTSLLELKVASIAGRAPPSFSPAVPARSLPPTVAAKSLSWMALRPPVTAALIS